MLLLLHIGCLSLYIAGDALITLGQQADSVPLSPGMEAEFLRYSGIWSEAGGGEAGNGTVASSASKAPSLGMQLAEAVPKKVIVATDSTKVSEPVAAETMDWNSVCGGGGGGVT